MSWDVSTHWGIINTHGGLLIIIITTCSAANKAAANKIVKYSALSASHIFLPVAVESAGTWNQSAIELIQEIGRRITAVTEDTRETVFLFSAYLSPCKGGIAVPGRGVRTSRVVCAGSGKDKSLVADRTCSVTGYTSRVTAAQSVALLIVGYSDNNPNPHCDPNHNSNPKF